MRDRLEIVRSAGPGAPRLQPVVGQRANRWLGAVAIALLLLLVSSYCRAYAYVSGTASIPLGYSLLWAVATLLPWGLLHFMPPSLSSPGDILRLSVLAIPAWFLSAMAAAFLTAPLGSLPLLLNELYGRLPILPLAVASLFLARLVLRRNGEAARPAGEAPPCPPRHISFVRAAGNYVELGVNGRILFWRRTMKEAELVLSSADFIRVHRSFLVPRRPGVRLTRGAGDRLLLVLQCGETIPVSRPYRELVTATFPAA